MIEKSTGELHLNKVKKILGSGEKSVSITIDSLDVNAGSMVTIVGDSGSGKTTLLRLIAGLENPDAGTIIVDGRDYCGIPSAQRDTPYIPHENSLLPHLTVAQNVAFPLGAKAVEHVEQQRVEVLLTTMNLVGISDRFPAELSAGQSQRVAIARALVLHPRLLLLDEPTANLDPSTREQVRRDIKDAQRRRGMSVLLVTHDPQEAMALGEKILVMHRGHIEGVGRPQDMYLRPTSVVCARALGDINLLSCAISAVTAGSYQVNVLGKTVWVSGLVPTGTTKAQLLVRPEHLRFESKFKNRETQVHANIAVVLETEFCGANRNFLVETIHGTLKIRADAAQFPFGPRDFVALDFNAQDAWLLP